MTLGVKEIGYTSLKKIISGGQSGADLGGLIAAQRLGLQTGGWLPKGCRTEDGPRIEYLSRFGMKEYETWNYAGRTRSNVADSDATIWFGRHESPGKTVTKSAATDYNRPFLDINIDDPPTADEVARWIHDNAVTVLNVAGHRESTDPGISSEVVRFLGVVGMLLRSAF